MKDIHDWTEDKIEFLKISFLQGNRLKQIAKTLEKTTSALNKALDRFGIRPSKRKPRYIEWSLNDPHCRKTLPSIFKFEKKKESSLKDRPSKRKRRFKDNSIWVSLPDVIHYVQNKGVSVKPLTKPFTSNFFSEALFLLDHKPLTALQLLFIANEFRIAEKQPIFLVGDVSW